MTSNAFLSTLFFFIFPLLGLLMGAILPPFHYARHPWLAGGSNLLGFLFYMFPFVMMTAVLNYVEQQAEAEGLWDPVITLVLMGVATVFIGIEALVFLLLWLRKRLRSKATMA